MNDTRFTFLCSQEERQKIQELANEIQRSQSDTIRWLINIFHEVLITNNATDSEIQE